MKKLILLLLSAALLCSCSSDRATSVLSPSLQPAATRFTEIKGSAEKATVLLDKLKAENMALASQLDAIIAEVFHMKKSAEAGLLTIQNLQGQVDQVTKERNIYAAKAVDYEIRLAKSNENVAWLVVALSGLIVCIGVYLFIKFYI